MKIFSGNKGKKKTQNKPNKISDLKITLAKGLSKCKTKNKKLQKGVFVLWTVI